MPSPTVMVRDDAFQASIHVAGESPNPPAQGDVDDDDEVSASRATRRKKQHRVSKASNRAKGYRVITSSRSFREAIQRLAEGDLGKESLAAAIDKLLCAKPRNDKPPFKMSKGDVSKLKRLNMAASAAVCRPSIVSLSS
jgi:hypothetical protein